MEAENSDHNKSAAPGQQPSSDALQFFQQRMNDLERRLYETQEKALMFSLELKNREELQRRSADQAEEMFEKLTQGQRSAAQEKVMNERLRQLEDICRRLEGSTASAAGTAGSAAADITQLKEAVERLNLKIGALGALMAEVGPLKSLVDTINSRIGAATAVTSEVAALRDSVESVHRKLGDLGASASEIGPLKGALEAVNMRLAAVSSAASGLAPLKSAVESAAERSYAFEARLAAMETRYNELSMKNELTQKMMAHEDSLLREKVDRLEKCAVPMDYVDRRMAGFELDSQAIRKVEGLADSLSRRMTKAEGASEAMLGEQARLAELQARDSTVLEELRAKFENMSVIFDHIRKLIGK